MATKSPTTSVRSREMIGVDQFSQRREVFDKHDTVFVPLPSPTGVMPVYKDVEPIVTSNHGKTTSNFKRNAAGYSSMRESRTEDRNHFDFRPRKYSDNFTSEANQSDNIDYRHTMTERTRRLSRMRREFLNSNLHEPNGSTLTRTGVRASMPTPPVKYKIESPNLYKFPFAEPYATPTPVRRVIVDLGSADEDNTSEGKENQDPEVKPKQRSVTLSDGSPTNKIDHHKLFEELVKRYSPQRKNVDWTLPPTRPRPRVVGSVPKSTSSAADSLDNSKSSKDVTDNVDNDEVFEKKDETEQLPLEVTVVHEERPKLQVLENGPENIEDIEGPTEQDTKTNDSRASLIAAEENDHVPELFPIQRQISKESPTSKKPPLDVITDLTIPEMIEKMTAEGDGLKNNKKDVKKVKRKRSFLDKLLGRNKGEKK